MDIDAAATVTIGQSLNVGVCLTNTTGIPVSAFQYNISYDDRIVRAGELPDMSTGLDDNPDANAGSTTFTSGTYTSALGTGWNCSDFVAPVGDADGVVLNGAGMAYSGSCASYSGPNTLISGPLGVVSFSAVGPGVATLSVEAAAVTDDNLVQIGSCNPTDIAVMGCTGGTITVQQGNGQINGKVYVNSVSPANVLPGALVQANGLAASPTDGTGSYSITGLPAGSYTVTATVDAPFTGAGIGPVSLGSGQILSGQDIIVTAPTGGVTGTAYKDSAIPMNVMPNAVVEACAAVCVSAITNGSGAYSVPYLPDGSYTVTLFPTGNYSQVAVSGVIVSGGVVVGAPNLVAQPLFAPPPGTVLPPIGNAVQPSVFSFDTFTLTKVGCPGGSASYTITQATVIRSGAMAEGPAGTYTAIVTPLTGADPGQAIVAITIDCPSDPDDVLTFDINIYIDPSGFVRDMDGNPIIGATVTLFRAESFYGPYVQVHNGSAFMSPANRTNPGLTDDLGHFGWDVSEGFYKVQASKPGCLVPEAFKRSAFKRSETTFESAALGIPPAVTDVDLRLDCTANPCDANDTTIPNSDSVPLENGPLAPGTDITILNSDTTNDSCDIDDDNDGILDVYEGGFPVTGCASATAPLGSLQIDTDGDRLTDGWECESWFGPGEPDLEEHWLRNRDADGDHVPDLWEQRGYNASGSKHRCDGDGCHDMVELHRSTATRRSTAIVSPWRAARSTLGRASRSRTTCSTSTRTDQ